MAKIVDWRGKETFDQLLKPDYESMRVSNWDRQMRYLVDYLSDPERPCRSVAIEDHYIDRHFMEDYAAFYSRSVEPIPNACRRVHLFSAEKEEVDTTLDDIRKTVLQGQSNQARADLLKEKSRDFSKRCYLGYVVIRPLRGAPVGTTVLRPFASAPKCEASWTRSFPATREYVAHLEGIPLTVEGIAFQQQDLGVSACATTAIWTALQLAQETEYMQLSSPAQITSRATSSVVVGRTMPSDGLSLEQVCAAIQSFGLSPHVTRVESSPAIAKWVIDASLRSGAPPIAILRRPETENQYHAVVVIGKKERTKRTSTTPRPVVRSPDISDLYVHDDRLGPYVLGQIETDTKGLRLALRVHKERRSSDDSVSERGFDRFEHWELEYIITALPVKVRLSLSEILSLALSVDPGEFAASIQGRPKGMLPKAVLSTWRAISSAGPLSDVEVTIRTVLTASYLQAMITNHEYGTTDPTVIGRLSEKHLPRTLAVIRYSLKPDGGFVEVLTDSTSTIKAPIPIAVVASGASRAAMEIANAIDVHFQSGTVILCAR